MIPYLLLLLSPICWASWLNFSKICKNWRFESFYVNYALSIVVITFAYGSWADGSSLAFLENIQKHGLQPLIEGVGAGIIWGIGNILLVAAIILCGLAVGLKIAIGLSLVLGVALTYAVNPAATKHPLFLLGGVLVVGTAIFTNGTAYRIREQSTQAGSSQFRRGISITVCCGVLIGAFPFLQGLAVKEGMNGVQLAFLLTVGDLLVALPLLNWLARHPIIPGNIPVALWTDYAKGRRSWHVAAILAGSVWTLGTITNLVAAVEHVGLSIAWAVGECSPLVGVIWGLCVFKEFTFTNKAAQRKARQWLIATFALYVAGIGLLFAAN